MGSNILYSKAFDFSLEIVRVYKNLCKENEYTLSEQILKCGTSIAANVKEGEAVQSKKDFISKNNIALKEARETEYWIELLMETGYMTENHGQELISELDTIIGILVKSINTTKVNLEQKRNS